MKKIKGWLGASSVEVVESAGGILATVDPLANLVRGGVSPWPPPELLQKLYASHRWRGKTLEDDQQARSALGHYSDLQSLNSEDAVTWSFFGPLIYGPPEERLQFVGRCLDRLGFPSPTSAVMWLWRRIPHPEKAASTGGPEIDFGIQTDECLVLGEAKWNSAVGVGQGIGHNRSQLDLRLAYCSDFGTKALPRTRHWAVLGVGRSTDILSAAPLGCSTVVENLSWMELLGFLPAERRSELAAYLAWKNMYSSKSPKPGTPGEPNAKG